MKTLAIYALEVLACSGVLLAAYAILLERHVRFGWCRAYLLASTLLAAVIPLLRICLLYTSPSPRDGLLSRMPSSA